MIHLQRKGILSKMKRNKTSEDEQKETFEFIKENALIISENSCGVTLNLNNKVVKDVDPLKYTKKANYISTSQIEEEKTHKNINFNITEKPQVKEINKIVAESVNVKQKDEEIKTKRESNCSIKTKSIVQGHMHQIDLECVLNIEQKLWNILDCFTGDTSSVNVFEFCEEWWDLVDSHTLSNIHSVFVEDLMRRSLRRAAILEFLAITMINFLSSECKHNKDLHGNLKVLIFYVHQNYLIFISCILQKLPPYNNSNIWIKTLK